jgi:hypothetical protein
VNPGEEPLQSIVETADVVEPWRPDEPPQWSPSAKVVEEMALRGRKHRGEIIEGQRYRDRYSWGELMASRQAVEPLLQESA